MNVQNQENYQKFSVRSW